VIAPGDELMGRYTVEALIASGGMADVHLGRDRRLDRTVAIKSFRIGASDPRRFEAEVRLLARLHHPNLLSVFDAGEHEGVPFVVLQYVEGSTLAERLAAGPLRSDEVQRLGIDLASALDYVHRHRVVHRDVKPSNILMDSEGRALLGDFGVAVLLDATRLTTDAGTIGTAAYLAPEQATGHDVDGRADTYALGLVLLEALTGEVAFTGSLTEVVSAKLSRDPDVPPGLPAPWPGLLTAMTSRDVNRRPGAGAVVTTLTSGAGGDGATMVLPVTHRLPAVAPGWRRPLAAVVTAIALIAGLVLLLAAASGDDPPALATSTTTTPTTTPPTTSTTVATTSTTSRDDRCEELDDQLEDLDDDDDDERGGPRRSLKKRIEDEMKALDC
jgi:serine/threonine protein kinase